MKIDRDNISHLCNIVISIVSLNITINEYKDNKISRINSIELPNKLQEIGIEICNRISENLYKSNKKDVFYMEDELGLRYIGFGVFNKDEYEGAIILGPYLNYEFQNNINNRIIQRNIYDSIPILNESQEIAISHIVVSVLNSKINKSNLIKLESKDSTKLNNIYTIDDYERNVIEIRRLYQSERELLHYVSKGDEQRALSLVKEVKTGLIDRFPEMPLRNMKNLTITMNTLCRKAVENNNIDEYFLHVISEKFAKKIEYAKNIKDLQQIHADMIREYCMLVSKHSNNNYSVLVSNAINYIKLNYNQDIGLDGLAKELFVHKTYLAKKFKEETDKTISQYINEVRVNEAKFMLKNTDLTIEDIGYYVGYNDKKYFSKTFKKILQKSPSEYKKYRYID